MKKILLLSAILTTTTPAISSVVSCNQKVSSDATKVNNIFNKIKDNNVIIPKNISTDIKNNIDELKNAIQNKNPSLTGGVINGYRTGDLSYFSFKFHSQDINKDKFILNEKILVDATIRINNNHKTKTFYVTMKEIKTIEQESSNNLINKISDQKTYFIPKNQTKDSVEHNILQIKNNIQSQNFNHNNLNLNITNAELDHLAISFWDNDVTGFFKSKFSTDTKPNGVVFLKLVAEYKNFTTGKLYIKEKRIVCKMLDESETATFIKNSINSNLTLEVKNTTGLNLSITTLSNAEQSQEWICRKIMYSMASAFTDFNGYYSIKPGGSIFKAEASFNHIIFNKTTTPLKINEVNIVTGNISYNAISSIAFNIKVRII